MIEKIDWTFNRDRRVIKLVDKINEIIQELNERESPDELSIERIDERRV